ncbi:unnamed protein product [[Candida] boidinii]|nr:unnamed protein product [[Candida] boidinii]
MQSDSRTKRSYKKTDLEPFYIGSANATISSNGEILATAVLEDIVIINKETNEILHKLQGDGDLITTLQLTPDGKYLAIISQSQQLKIFNLSTSSFIKTYKLSSPSYISSVDKTSTLFAFGLTDGSVVVWDIEGSFITHNFKGHGATISALSFFGDLNSRNWKICSGDIMGNVRIWDLVKRKCIKTMNEHTAAVRGVKFNTNGNLFLSGGRDNVCILWNTKTWKEIKTIAVNQTVESVGFINTNNNDSFDQDIEDIENEELFYSAGDGCVLKIWNIKSETLVATSPMHLETTEELSIMDVIQPFDLPDRLYIVLSDQTIEEIEIDINNNNNNNNNNNTQDLKLSVVRRLAGNHGTIADMRFVGPNLDKLALATNSPSLRIVDLINSPLDIELYEGHTDLLNGLDSTIDGKWLATAAKDNTARLWRYNEETDKFEIYAVFEGHASSITALGLPKTPITNYPKFLITASEDLTIKKWNIPKPIKKQLIQYEEDGDNDNNNNNNNSEIQIVKTSVYTRRAHEKLIHSISISPNDEFIATASHDKLAKIWDIENGETVGVLKGHKRPIYDINFCLYDKLIVTGSGDQTSKVWSLENFSCLKTFQSNSNAIQRVSFLSKNQFIIGACANGLIKIWEISSGDCVQTLDNHDNRIWALCIKNDGEEFISADADGSITIWKDNTEEVQALEEETRIEKVEKEQELQNLIREKDWFNAFLLALSLDHPMRLYNVLKSCISENQDKGSIIGNFKLEESIDQI